MITPFRITIGFGCLMFSLLLIAALVISNIDRFMHSKCGFACGYFIESYTLFNPLDWLLTKLSILFPLDLVFMTMMLLYIFITCLFSIIRLGVKPGSSNVIIELNLLGLSHQKKTNISFSFEYSRSLSNCYDICFQYANYDNSSKLHIFWIAITKGWNYL